MSAGAAKIDQPVARPLAGGWMASALKPARGTSHEMSEFEFHASLATIQFITGRLSPTRSCEPFRRPDG